MKALWFWDWHRWFVGALVRLDRPAPNISLYFGPLAVELRFG